MIMSLLTPLEIAKKYNKTKENINILIANHKIKSKGFKMIEIKTVRNMKVRAFEEEEIIKYFRKK